MLAAKLGRHIAIVMLPIMIVTLVVVLQMLPIPAILRWAYPAGLLGASLWTRAWLVSTVAAVHVQGNAVAVRTFAQLASRAPLEWVRLTDLEHDEESIHLTAGLSPYRLLREDWESSDALIEALEATRE